MPVRQRADVLAVSDGVAADVLGVGAVALSLVLGVVVALPVVGVLLARLPWRPTTHLDGPPPGADPAAGRRTTAGGELR